MPELFTEEWLAEVNEAFGRLRHAMIVWAGPLLEFSDRFGLPRSQQVAEQAAAFQRQARANSRRHQRRSKMRRHG